MKNNKNEFNQMVEYTKEELDIFNISETMTLRELKKAINNIGTNGFHFAQFEGQREYKARPKNRNGFLTAIIACGVKRLKAKRQQGNVSNNMKALVMKLKNKVINTSNINIVPATNCTFFCTNTGKIFDGQHRYNWFAGFFNDQYVIPTEVKYAAIAGLKWSELEMEFPELAEEILNIPMELVILDTDDIQTVAKYFYQMNSGGKPVQPKEAIMALQAGSSSLDYYKSMDKVASETTFRGREAVKTFITRSWQQSFVRSVCYMTGTDINSSPELTLNHFLSLTDGKTENEFFSDMRSFAYFYRVLEEDSMSADFCLTNKGRSSSMLCKFMYLLGKKHYEERTKSLIEGYFALPNEDLLYAKQQYMANRKTFLNILTSMIYQGEFDIKSSVKQTSLADEKLRAIFAQMPSLNLTF